MLNQIEPCIVVENLRKNYGSVEAVRGISFEVKPGEIFEIRGITRGR